MPGDIKLIGGISLLVSGLTGPAIAVIPQLFQDAGWLTPLVAFLLVAFFAGAAALFLVEAMASVDGNEYFKASIEFSTLAELFLGRKWHWAFQIALYIALQSQTIASLIESFQSMDALLVTVAHKSCAISFRKGWECVKMIPPTGQGVFTDYIFMSFGYLITLVLVLPLGLIHLSDNIKFQIFSFITLLVVTVVWIATFFQVGIRNHPIPAVTTNQGAVLGYVISNFAFVTTVPAYVNNIHPSTNIPLVVWLSIVISTVVYITVGLAGAGAFDTPPNSTILNVLSERRPSIIALISVYAFPIAVLVTSIPVFMIVVRYNLLRGNICSKPWAIFWSSIVPWIIVIPFQTNGWLSVILNWTSIFFASTANLVVPFVLYLLSKRYRASVVVDIDTEHDVYQLQPLEVPNVEAPPLRKCKPRSPVQRPWDIDILPTESTERLVPPFLTVDMSEPSLAVAASSGEVIRLVRSPSVHRNYGEPMDEATQAATRRRRSPKMAADPNGTRDGADEERAPFTPAALLPPPPPRHSPTVLSYDTLAPSLSRESSTKGDGVAGPVRRTVSLPLPRIKINTPTPIPLGCHLSLERAASSGDAGSLSLRKQEHKVRSSFEKYNASGLPLPMEEAEDPLSTLRKESRLPVPPPDMERCVSAPGTEDWLEVPELDEDQDKGDREGSPPLVTIEDASLADLSSSLNSSDNKSPPWRFEAFPMLGRQRWFNSTKAAMACCALTTTMVLVAIIYNIVLATHGQSHG